MIITYKTRLVGKGSVGPTMAGVRALVLFLSLYKDSKDYDIYSRLTLSTILLIYD